MDLSKYGMPNGLQYHEYNSQTQPQQIYNFFNGITTKDIISNSAQNIQLGGGINDVHELNSEQGTNECNSVYLIFNHPAFETNKDDIINLLKNNPETSDIEQITDLQELFKQANAKEQEDIDDDESSDDEPEPYIKDDDDEDDEDDEEEKSDDTLDGLQETDDSAAYNTHLDNESTASLGAILNMLKTHYSSAKNSSK